MIEHDGTPIGLLVGAPDYDARAFRIHDVRIDFDHRRQGLAMALLYQAIGEAREKEFRAVSAETTTENYPAAQLLLKCGFEVAGLDIKRYSNHDLVKESVAMFWYTELA